MTRLLARPPARLPAAEVRGRARAAPSAAHPLLRGGAGAGSSGAAFPGRDVLQLVGRGENFPERLEGGKQGPAGCVRPPRRLRGGGGGRPGAEACARPSCRARAPEGRAAVLSPREGGSGRLAPPSPGAPGSRVLRRGSSLCSRCRNGVSYVVSSPLKFIMVELQTAHGWKSYISSNSI